MTAIVKVEPGSELDRALENAHRHDLAEIGGYESFAWSYVSRQTGTARHTVRARHGVCRLILWPRDVGLSDSADRHNAIHIDWEVSKDGHVPDEIIAFLVVAL